MAKKSVKEYNDIMRETILEHTQEWEKDEYQTDVKPSAKAQELSKCVTEMSFSKEDKTRLAKTLSLITGEVVELEDGEDFKHGVPVGIVCIKADKSHNYTTGETLISIGDGTAVKPDGSVGNFIKPSRKIIRPATAEEVAAISDTQIKGLSEVVTIVIKREKAK